MKTKSSRIAVTFERDTKTLLTIYAKKEHMSIAKVVREFVRNGLARREDKWLSELAEKREVHSHKNIKHADAWQ